MLRGGRIVLFDEEDQVTRDVDLLVSRGRISQITAPGDSAWLELPEVTLDGRFVLPGLIDAHAHPDSFTPFVPEAYLYWGVTTLGDAGITNPYRVLATVEAVRAGRRPGPYVVTAAGGGFCPIAGTLVESRDIAREEVAWRASLGAAHIKAYCPLYAVAEVLAVLEAAHEAGLPMLSHHVYPATLAAGADRKEHAPLWTLPRYGVRYRGDVLEAFRQAEIPVTASLAGNLPYYVGNQYLAHLDDGATKHFYPPWIIEGDRQWAGMVRQMAQMSDPDWQRVRESFREHVRALHEGGVRIIAGADGIMARGAVSMLWEVEELVRAGLSPVAALRAATVDAARVLGIEGEVGSIAEGKRADLLILEAGANPLNDIGDVGRITAVMKGGRLYERQALLETAARDARSQLPGRTSN